MKLAVISFTGKGSQICGRLVKHMWELGWECNGYVPERFINTIQEAPGICPVRESVMEWTKARFDLTDGLIYIGAAGIAVRAIAPCLRDKMTDPAVIVIDEAGRYVISLLSGHVGGANELANTLANILDAEPVVTTASDVRQMTAIDVWAKKRGLVIGDKVAAKQVAASLLDGEPVGFYSDYPVEDGMPDGFTNGELCRNHVWITARIKPPAGHMLPLFMAEDSKILHLIPKSLMVGIGCRKGIGEAAVVKALRQVFEAEHLDLRAIAGIASIDIKKGEEGLLAAADWLQVPFSVYQAKELNQVGGEFTPSEFVRGITGTDNVCERSALLACKANGRLLVRKQAVNGVTVAVAERPLHIGNQIKD